MKDEMMTITINIGNLNSDELETLNCLIDTAGKKRQTDVWKPIKDETYWHVTEFGYIRSRLWVGSIYDQYRYQTNNCFRCKEEAEYITKQHKICVELQRFAQEHNDPIEWNNSTSKWYFGYDHNTGKIYFEDMCRIQFGPIPYFSSQTLAREAVNYIGEERLKKYYFGVKED